MLARRIEHIDQQNKDAVSILRYRGAFSDDVTQQSIYEIDSKLSELLQGNSGLKKRIIYLFVEQFQNVIRHGEKKGNQIYPEGTINVDIIDDTCFITSYNYCNKAPVGKLIEYIESINKLNAEEIREKYRFHLEENSLSAKGGAGLGLLDMRRRTKNKIESSLISLDNNEYVFRLKLRVNLK